MKNINSLTRHFSQSMMYWLASRLGFAVFPYDKDNHYVNLIYGKSAHKHLDIKDVPIFDRISKHVIEDGNTLLYYDRLYTIYQALENVVRHKKDGRNSLQAVEIGVYKGGGSYFIASVIKELYASNASIHCFDTFEGHAGDDIKNIDTFHKAKMFDDTRYESVKSYLSDFSDIILFKGRFQDNCEYISNYLFDFIHLDVDLYEPTEFALKFFANRLCPGAIIIVDDYGFTTCPGVKQAVDEFIHNHSDFVGIHLLTGQYVLIYVRTI